MDSFVDYSGQAGFQDTAEDEHPHYTSSAADLSKTAFFGQHHISCDIKPRLTKEQHDVLEGHFRSAPKPNTATKKGFADTLGVSLDKVNNWFQNRRAKSKQDAKKANGTYNVLAQQQANQGGFGSDSETSPAYPAHDYFDAMQQYTAENHVSEGLGISRTQQYHDRGRFVGLPYDDTLGGAEQFHYFDLPHQIPQEMFDSPRELNRRTLTQEQFDVFAQNGSAAFGPENYGLHQSSFPAAHGMMDEVFPVSAHQSTKQQNAFVLPNNVPPPMSSHDSSIQSSISEHYMAQFPSAATMQEQGNMSASSSEWDGSRSSSLHQQDPFLHVSAPAQHQATTTSQWQPGQSVPVDFNALSHEFRQVAHARQSPQQPQVPEQPLAWPDDEAFVRKDSNTSMLVQHMSSVGIHAPQPPQQGISKSPAPPASIAARRQRPRPAGLHLGAARSQSYNGTAQLGSPGQLQQQSLTPGQPLRRIRSSNIVANGVAQGRVQKLPGSAQRSPLAWTFADAMNSPKALRHVSSQSTTNLAPPTPMSPSEFPRPQIPSWQASGHVSRQPSISETDLEHGVANATCASVPPQNFSSPPHTPMYHQQIFVQHRMANNIVTENTPPQSAPSSQQCFPANTFAVTQPQMQPPPHQTHTQAPPQQMRSFAPLQQQQLMKVIVPDQHFQVPNTTFAPGQHFMVPTTGAPAGLPMNFKNGIPMFNDQGDLQMMYPSSMQFTQQPQAQPQPLAPQQQMHTPHQGQYGMFTTAGSTPGIQITATLPRQPSPQPPAEFFVHEYSPPQSVKRTATPRKDVVDTGPKNYVFANQTPENFEKGKKAVDSKASATASNSPASASSS